MNGPPPNPAPCPGPSPGHAETPGPVAARAAVHFLCIRRYVTVADANRAQGPIVRCPKCGKAATLPPRQVGDPAIRRFDIGC